MCWDFNVTIENSGPTTRTSFRVQVEFDPAQTNFPEVSKWYEGKSGRPVKLTSDGRVWEITFDIELAPSASTHVGWDFENDDGFDISGGGYRFFAMLGTKGQEETIGLLAIRLRGGVMTVANRPCASELIMLTAMSAAGSPEVLSLDQLIEGDEALESLEWHDLLFEGPMEVFPGEKGPVVDARAFDLKGFKSAIARITVADIEEGVRLTSFHQIPIEKLVAGQQKSQAFEVINL